jgi:hypothetical protein
MELQTFQVNGRKAIQFMFHLAYQTREKLQQTGKRILPERQDESDARTMEPT